MQMVHVSYQHRLLTTLYDLISELRISFKHTHTKGASVSNFVINVLLEQSYGYLHYLDWVIMFCLISFHTQNTAESENAFLTLRALFLCDKPFLKNYEIRLKFHIK
jgi:hypothetical protein